MRLDWMVFLLLLAMCAVLGSAFLIEELPFKTTHTPEGIAEIEYLGHGYEHPRYPTMQVGGDGATRQSKIIWFGWAFGALQIIFFVVCLAMGASRKGKLGPYTLPLAAGCVIFLLVFTALVFSHREYASQATHSLVLNQAAPTAWMVYGLWGFPLYFLFLYILTFDKWFVTDDDLERFGEIMAEKQRNEVDGP